MVLNALFTINPIATPNERASIVEIDIKIWRIDGIYSVVPAVVLQWQTLFGAIGSLSLTMQLPIGVRQSTIRRSEGRLGGVIRAAGGPPTSGWCELSAAGPGSGCVILTANVNAGRKKRLVLIAKTSDG